MHSNPRALKSLIAKMKRQLLFCVPLVAHTNSSGIPSIKSISSLSSALRLYNPGQIIDVTDMALKMRESVRDYVRRQKEAVKLVGVLAHDGPCRDDCEHYSDIVAQTCSEDGIRYEVSRVSGEKFNNVEEAVQEANERPDVHGIIVYYPIYKRRDALTRGPYKNMLTGVYYKSPDDYLRDLVSPEKDVEGLCHNYNARWLFRARGLNRARSNNVVYPCTALSVLTILQNLCGEGDWSGLTVTIINRSEILGRPLAAMLANQGANVYSVDIDSVLFFGPGGQLRRVSNTTLARCVEKSSIIVSGVPSSSFVLPCHIINPGSIVVNVSEYSNIPEEVLQVPRVQFVPQVGKMTVAALERNLVHLHENRNANSQ
jgi:methylenetetrahydrofolate dehydrogenase (NAD+)